MESYFPQLSGTQRRRARERVLDDLRVLAGDAEMLLNATLGEVGDKAGAARERLKAGLARTKAALGELQLKGLATARAASTNVDDAIRDHPFETAGIALGIGFLLGLVLSKK